MIDRVRAVKLVVAVIAIVIPTAIVMIGRQPDGANAAACYGVGELAASAACIRTIHFKGWYLDSDGRKIDVEGWSKSPGKLILYSRNLDLLYDGSKLVEYHKGSFSHVTIRKPNTFSFQKDGMNYLQFITRTGFSRRWTEDETEQWSNCRCVRLRGGDLAYVIDIDALRLRTSVTIEQNTGRPVEWVEYDTDGRVVGTAKFDQYGVPVSDQLFRIDIPGSCAVIDLRTCNSTQTSSRVLRKRLEARSDTELVMDLSPGCSRRLTGGQRISVECVGSRRCEIFHLGYSGSYRVVGKALIEDRMLGKYRVVEDEDINLPSELMCSRPSTVR